MCETPPGGLFRELTLSFFPSLVASAEKLRRSLPNLTRSSAAAQGPEPVKNSRSCESNLQVPNGSPRHQNQSASKRPHTPGGNLSQVESVQLKPLKNESVKLYMNIKGRVFSCLLLCTWEFSSFWLTL